MRTLVPDAAPGQSAVHAIILTLNEERHIRRCIESLRGQCSTITVVDSGSTDGTVAIARSLGGDVIANHWVNPSTQVNFAIERLEGRGGWIFRIDADEVLDTDSALSIAQVVSAEGADVDGLLVQRRIYFMGKRIRYGGIEPIWQLRLWKNGRGRCEQRWMDEHVRVVGKVAKTSLIVSDINLNSLTWWTAKHNSYSSREAVDLLRFEYGLGENVVHEESLHRQAAVKRWIKETVYARLPRGLRALAYFLYRYVLRLGFLDGAVGARFHFLQGFWYRYLVDAKVAEVKQVMATSGMSTEDAIEQVLGIRTN